MDSEKNKIGINAKTELRTIWRDKLNALRGVWEPGRQKGIGWIIEINK